LKLKISTIQGRLADGAYQTVVHSYQLDLRSETELQIQVKELLFDNAYLSKVIEDKKSWFMQMEVLDLIYHQFFFTANSLGHQPMTSQYFQPLTLQTLELAAAAIHCALSEYASGKKATVMFSQDEYQGTFCPSPVINLTQEATAHINHTLLGHLIPPAVQLCKDRRSTIPIGAPEPRLTLFDFIPHSIPPLSTLLNSHRRTSVWIVASILNSALLTPIPLPPLSTLLRWYGGYLIPVGAPQSRFGTPQSPSALLSLDLAIFFMLRSFITVCVILFCTQYFPSGPPLFLDGCSPFSSE